MEKEVNSTPRIRNVQVTGSTPVVGSSTSGTLQALLNLRE
jgi:hypothetical protein